MTGWVDKRGQFFLSSRFCHFVASSPPQKTRRMYESPLHFLPSIFAHWPFDEQRCAEKAQKNHNNFPTCWQLCNFTQNNVNWRENGATKWAKMKKLIARISEWVFAVLNDWPKFDRWMPAEPVQNDEFHWRHAVFGLSRWRFKPWHFVLLLPDGWLAGRNTLDDFKPSAPVVRGSFTKSTPFSSSTVFPTVDHQNKTLENNHIFLAATWRSSIILRFSISRIKCV